MATESIAATSPNSVINNVISTSTSQINPIVLNSTKLLVKLTSSNFLSWKAQFAHALLYGYGYDMLGFIHGTKPCSSYTVLYKAKALPNPEFVIWKIQDELLFHEILYTLSSRALWANYCNNM